MLKILTLWLLISSLAVFSQSNLSEDERQILEQGEIPTETYVVGGIIGTLFGFGIGHGIQSRFSNRGWIFTVGEAGSFLVMAATASGCLNRVYFYSTATCSTVPGTFTLGALAFLGFRIWEIVDVWVGPPQHNRTYQRVKGDKRASFFITPLEDRGLKAGVIFSDF